MSTSFILPTRDDEYVVLTPASFTREGVAELAVERELSAEVRSEATIITAAQARTLADALDTLAREWGA